MVQFLCEVESQKLGRIWMACHFIVHACASSMLQGTDNSVGLFSTPPHPYFWMFSSPGLCITVHIDCGGSDLLRRKVCCVRRTDLLYPR